MKKVHVFVFIILLIFLSFILCGCDTENDENIVNDKILAENEYLEVKIFYMIKNFFEGNYMQTVDRLDWKKIDTDFAAIKQSSAIIISDLSSKQIDSNEIYNFEQFINDVSLSISNKDQNNFLLGIANLYSMIPKYLDGINANKIMIDSKNIKSELLFSIYFAFVDDYDNSNLYINQVERSYNELIKFEEYLEDNSYQINKIYVKLQEIKLAIQNKNIDEVLKIYLESFEWF